MKRLTFAALAAAALLATMAFAATPQRATEDDETRLEYLPSVNFQLDGQVGGSAFTIPPA